MNDSIEQCVVSPPDPVHQHKDGTWWFYDELWVDEYGPFKDEAEAKTHLQAYFEKWLEGNQQIMAAAEKRSR